MRLSRLSFCLLMIGITLETVLAQDSKSTVTNLLKAPPPPEAIDTPILSRASRMAIGAGVSYLFSRTTNDVGLAMPPINTRNIVSWNSNVTIHVRYSEKTIMEPIYENIYESYKTFGADKGPSVDSSLSVKQRTERRIVGRKKIGERPRTILVRDAQGEIVRTETRNADPVYDDGPDVWTATFLGQNGMALCTLLRSGVSEDHEVISRMATQLHHYVKAFGMPDHTWSLAWLAAGFAQLKGERYQETRDRLINKLLDGQITEGAARGLWGPVCINMPLFAYMLQYQKSLNEEVAKRKAMLDRTPNSKTQSEKLEEARSFLDAYQKAYQDITTEGMKFEQLRNDSGRYLSRYRRAAEKPDDEYLLETGYSVRLPPVNTPPLPYYIYNMTLADLEMTSLALFAIREAARNNCLPESTARPKVAGRAAFLPPESTAAILARSANAMADLQKDNGRWDEGNFCHEITTFRPLGFPGPKTGVILGVESPTTMKSTVQTYSALINAGQAVGLDKLLGKFRNHVMKAKLAQDEIIQSYFDMDSRDPKNINKFGRLVPPYDFLFTIKDAHRRFGSNIEDSREVWKRIAYQLLHLQTGFGSWRQPEPPNPKKKTPPPVIVSTSQIAWQKAVKQEADPKQTNPSLPPDTWDSRPPYGDPDLMRTCYAILFLLEGVRPPVGAYWAWTPQAPPSRLLPQAVGKLELKHGFPLSVQQLPPALPYADLSGLPILVITGSGSDLPSDSKAWDNLARYIHGGGLIMVETLDDTSSRQFSANMEGKLQTLISGSRVADVPATAPFLKAFGANAPKLRGLVLNEKLVALFVLLQASRVSSANTLNEMQAFGLTSELLKWRVSPEIFEKDYPAAMAFVDDFTSQRIFALDDLNFAVTHYLNPDAFRGEKTGDSKPLDLTGLGIDLAPGAAPATKSEPQKKEEEDGLFPPPPPVPVNTPAVDEAW